ncbi:hypothetical protein AA313_de0208934 [Arthrobotrys entomopaga]|nr:hypothetical protein AA313_de0208934 [Arthrobotrys entomopaga]
MTTIEMSNPEGITTDVISSPPNLTSDDLEIDPATMEPMGHGGHSLVSKVNTKSFPNPSVLKIFRFTMPPNPASPDTSIKYTGHPRDPDDAYFLSEKASYTLLQTSQSHTYTPKLHTAITISPSLEPHFLAYYNPRLHRQKRQRQLKLPKDQSEGLFPLKAVLIEYIPGLRLSAFRSIPITIGQKIIDGMEYIHSKGIFHRDVKKRNVMIVPNIELPVASEDTAEEKIARDIILDGSEKVVWIDFSNSLVISDFQGDGTEREESFSRALEEEMEDVYKMVERLQR